MEREYNVGTWLTPSDEYIKDIKQTLVEKGVATELTPNEELSESINNIKSMGDLLDYTKSMRYMFYQNTKITDLTPFFKQNDTKNVEDMTNMCSRCTNLISFPKINMSKVTRANDAFSYCSSLKEFYTDDTSALTQVTSMFLNCVSIETISGIDFLNVNVAPQGFVSDCRNLKNLYIKNIKYNLQIGYGTLTGSSSYGHLLTLDSLVNTCKECIKTYSRTLTVGTANIEKLANVYVRFVDINQTTIAEGEKGDVVVCEADNNDAMTITEYMALKSWTLA